MTTVDFSELERYLEPVTLDDKASALISDAPASVVASFLGFNELGDLAGAFSFENVPEDVLEQARLIQADRKKKAKALSLKMGLVQDED